MLLFKGKGRAVAGLAFSPDGSTLAACGEGEVVEFWDLATGAVGHTSGPEAFDSAADNIRFDPTGEWGFAQRWHFSREPLCKRDCCTSNG